MPADRKITDREGGERDEQLGVLRKFDAFGTDNPLFSLVVLGMENLNLSPDIRQIYETWRACRDCMTLTRRNIRRRC